VRNLRLIIIGAVVAMVLAGCQVDSQVAIRVNEGGSGTVTVTVRLDAEAAQRLGDPATSVYLSDLVAAGWVVDNPKTETAGPAKGGVTLAVRRKFGSPDELAQVLGEIGGTPGETGSPAVFSDVQLKLTDGFASTNYSFSSVLRLTGSLEQFSDPELTAALGGLPLARTPEELAAEGLTAAKAATLKVSVHLPGTLEQTTGKISTGSATTGKIGTGSAQGESATWEFPLSGGTASSATMTAQSSDTQPLPTRLLIAAAALLVLAGVFLTVGLLRRRH
jgi:hypothetical protein